LRVPFVVVVGFVLPLFAGAGAVACGWDWTVVPKADGSEGGTKEGGPPGADCTSSDQCLADEYCAFDDGLCGAGNRGICTINKCTEQPDLVCGCDGKVYDNGCAISRARVDYSINRCAQPPGALIKCGAVFCKEAEAFCFSDAKCVPWGKCASPAERTCACAVEVVGDCPNATCDKDAGPPSNLRCN